MLAAFVLGSLLQQAAPPDKPQDSKEPPPRLSIEQIRAAGETIGLAFTPDQLAQMRKGVSEQIDTYERLEALARGILAAGYPVIVDATFLRRSQRDGFRALATSMDVPFAVAACEAPEAALRERLDLRSKRLGDASEADAQVLAQQIAAREPLGESEHALIIETTRKAAVEAAVAALACRVRESKRA